jgi:hypothetical protein
MLSERKSDHRERTYAENERRTVENQSNCRRSESGFGERARYLTTGCIAWRAKPIASRTCVHEGTGGLDCAIRVLPARKLFIVVWSIDRPSEVLRCCRQTSVMADRRRIPPALTRLTKLRTPRCPTPAVLPPPATAFNCRLHWSARRAAMASGWSGSLASTCSKLSISAGMISKLDRISPQALESPYNELDDAVHASEQSASTAATPDGRSARLPAFFRVEERLMPCAQLSG